jgi:hypothetical protein
MGGDTIKRLQNDMKGWYGGPVQLIDVPGNVSVTPDGDFVGNLIGGQEVSCLESMEGDLKKWWKDESKRKHLIRVFSNPRARAQLGMAGFTSLSDLVSEATVAGKMQPLGGNIQRVGTTGVIGSTNSLWRVGNAPFAGAAAAALPGGTVPTSVTQGALGFVNPPSGDLQYIVSGDIQASSGPNSLLIYDRLFAGALAIGTTAAQPITGVPTRYTNTVAGQPNSAVGNFFFPEIGTVLPATAHTISWVFTNQAGVTNQAGTTVTGVSAGAVNRLDMANQWFVPLGTGTAHTGVLNLTSATLSATLASGAIDLVMGHPLAWAAIPLANIAMPFDWVWQKFAPARVFDGACVAMLEVGKGATNATTYTGSIMAAWG